MAADAAGPSPPAVLERPAEHLTIHCALTTAVLFVSSAEEAEDMELAWQMLEIARVAYGKAPKNTAQNQKLADVYSRLGDHSQMNDHFDQAVQDYKSALKIREQSHDLSSTNIKRVLASDMCNIARALQYSDPPDFQRALDYTKNAAAAMDEVSGSDPSVAEMRDELQEKVRASPRMASGLHC